MVGEELFFSSLFARSGVDLFDLRGLSRGDFGLTDRGGGGGGGGGTGLGVRDGFSSTRARLSSGSSHSIPLIDFKKSNGGDGNGNPNALNSGGRMAELPILDTVIGGGIGEA